MKPMTYLYWLVLALSVVLNIQQKFTADFLLATNDMLLEEAQKPHPVHDADITAWIGKDKALTVVVNGMFQHKFAVTCYEGKEGKF